MGADAGPWNDLKDLGPKSLAVVDSLGFTQMTPVQASTIPLFLSKKDVVVEALTGSGKTLAFLIPVFEILSKKQPVLKPYQIGAVILVPTRELAIQISEILSNFTPHFPGIVTHLCIGGSDVAKEMQSISQHGCNLIVGTPGRLVDLIGQFEAQGNSALTFSFRELEVLIFDEADRLLDMGFERSISTILAKLPKQRRTGLFSATLSDSVKSLIKAGLRNPVRISVQVDDASVPSLPIPSGLSIYSQVLPAVEKPFQLWTMLRENATEKIMVYFGTCASVSYYFRIFTKLGLKNLSELHGKLEAKKRSKIYQAFCNDSQAILFCTDIAARGLDFDNVDLVVHYDLPQDPAAFVHRSGRTARIGKTGRSVVLLMPNEELYVEYLNKRRIPITILDEIPSSKEEMALFYQQVYNVITSDRIFVDNGIRAFVSFVRHYNGHLLNLLLKTKELDFSGCIQSFFLLYVPKMPEIRDSKQEVKLEMLPSGISTDTIDYQDPNLKKQRLAHQKKKKERSLAHHQKSLQNIPWSKSKKLKLPNQPMKQEKKPAEEEYDSLDDDYKQYKKEKKSK